jgi:chromosomal replication initiation ATPase DnaA
VSTYASAASVYEAWRNRGETPEDAMRAAVRVVRANEAAPPTWLRNAIPREARETIEAVALSHGMDTYRLRSDNSKTVIQIRGEAIHVARALGNGTPSFAELGSYFGKDHSSLVGGDKAFRRRLEADAILRARVERWVAARGEKAA